METDMNKKNEIENEIMMLREKVKPFTGEQYRELEQNTFQSPWTDYRQYNGMKFKILFEHFDDDTREPFGNECSVAWIGGDGSICSNRFFEIQLENGVTITAEHEEISNYYIETNQM